MGLLPPFKTHTHTFPIWPRLCFLRGILYRHSGANDYFPSSVRPESSTVHFRAVRFALLPLVSLSLGLSRADCATANGTGCEEENYDAEQPETDPLRYVW